MNNYWTYLATRPSAFTWHLKDWHLQLQPSVTKSAYIGAYYNGPKFKFQPASGTEWFSYKIWTKNSKTPMVNLLKNLRPFQNYNFKIQWEIHFFTFLIIDQNALKFCCCYVIRYTFQSNLLSELILDLGKCPNQKTHESESAGFLLRALPEVQNQFRKQIWLKSIPNYITKLFFSERFYQ